MSDNVLQKVGRVYYVEPNNIYNKSSDTIYNMPNGIPHPYEDYCISVDLFIELADRNSLGPVGPAGGSKRVLKYSSDNQTISFIGGTNGFLTTNFTDIQSTNPEQNTNECLGIESIKITYNSWYVPQVNIRFVDVRGASLMSPQEQGYVRTVRDNINTGHATNTKINGGSFFKALFSFPYPMFKLKIKGFYGKEVTYNLCVEDFQGNFNAENGNFEVDVKFIGYMFGVYTDIPMNYLMVSPYISGIGDKYWAERKASGDFRYYGSNSSDFLTYPELHGKITNLTPENDSVSGSDTNYSKAKFDIQGKIDALKNIKDQLNTLLRSIFEVGYDFAKKEDGKYVLLGITQSYWKINLVYQIDKNESWFTDALRRIKKSLESETLSEGWKALVKDSEDTKCKKNRKYKIEPIGDFYREYITFLGLLYSYNDTYKDDELDLGGITGGLTIQNSSAIGITYQGSNFNIVDEKGQYCSKDPQETPADDTNFATKEIKYSVNGMDGNVTAFQWVSNKLSHDKYNIGTYMRVFYPGNIKETFLPNWVCEIDEKINTLNAQLNKIETEIEANRNTSISNALGFGVSIGNAFNMAFAHMDTFMYVFNYYLNEIKYQQERGNRSLAKLGNFGIENTDLPSKFNGQVPPFTLFYKDVENDKGGTNNINEKSGKKKVVMWPGNIEGINASEVLPEIKFVNELIRAGEGFARETKQQETANAIAKDALKDEGGESQYVATTLYDLAHVGSVNPYAYLSSIEDVNMVYQAMFLTFALRLLYWYNTNSQHGGTTDWDSTLNSDDTFKNFGKIEAYNFFKAHSTILPSIKQYIKNKRDGSGNVQGFESLGIETLLTEDSKDDARTYLDLGKGVFKKHFMIKSGDNYQYDWMDYITKVYPTTVGTLSLRTRFYPVANIPPLAINVDKLKTTNSECIGVYISDEDTIPSDVDFQFNKDCVGYIETRANDEGSKLIYYQEYLNVLDSDIVKDTKDCYTKHILPGFHFSPFAVNIFASNEKDRKNHQACVVSGLKNSVFAGQSNKRQTNSRNFFVNIPSFIGVASKEKECVYYPLFGHPIFYEQNTHENTDNAMLAKAYLYVAGIPIHTNNANGKTMVVPFYSALKEGAMWFRKRWMEEHGGEDLIKIPNDNNYIKVPSNGIYCMGLKDEYKKTNLISSNYGDMLCVLDANGKLTANDYSTYDDLAKSGNNKEALADFFEKWAKNVYAKKLSGIFEVKNIKNGADFKSVINKLNSLDKSKKKQLDSGMLNPDFYDVTQELIIKNGKAIEIPTVRVSNVQADLLENYDKFLITVDTSAISVGADKKHEMFITKKAFQSASEGFVQALHDIYKEQIDNDSIPSQSFNNELTYDPNKDEDLKISTYLTLKNLYDRWICMNDNVNRWKYKGGKDSEFTHFKFIDGFYRKIEQKAPVNFQYISELASEMMASSNVTNDSTNLKYQGRSFYDFLSSVCQKNQMMLLSLPMENEFTDDTGITEAFNVIPYSKMDNRDTSCFVCLYSNKPSQHLDIEYDDSEYAYKTDGFNIANAYGKILEKNDLIPQLSDTDIDGYTIPAFGVTYGKQNQSIFKKVSVNMQNPQVTEASIAATQLIASKDTEGPNKTALFGQDLYRIYANYSYTCSVEMLGDAQIMPLTYFQLNNIPLFRGAYMIINIEHDIVAGDMTTRFTGVRMSRYELPFVEDNGIFNDPFMKTDIGSFDWIVSGVDKIDIPSLPTTIYELDKDVVLPGEHKYAITLRDLLKSETAKEKGIDNTPKDPKHVQNVRYMQIMLQRIQDAWVTHCSENSDKPWSSYDKLNVSSGYRCPELNAAVNGSKTSSHMCGLAADIRVANRKGSVSYQYTQLVFHDFLVGYMEKTSQKWDQIIDEARKNSDSRWVHYSPYNCAYQQKCEKKKMTVQ